MPKKETKQENKNQNIGALWINEGKNIKYLAGEIELDGKVTKIVVFKNSYKTEEKHPDYRIFVKTSKKDVDIDDIM